MRLIRRTDSGMVIAVLLAVALLIIAGVVLGDQIKAHSGALQAWIGVLAPWGVVVSVALLVLGTSLLVPESVFGVRWGSCSRRREHASACSCGIGYLVSLNTWSRRCSNWW